MVDKFEAMTKQRVERIRGLSADKQGSEEWLEAGALALTVLYDTVGGAHPLYAVLDEALKTNNWLGAAAASRAVVMLYNDGGLESPRLAVAHEIDGSLLDVAQAQLQAAETSQVDAQKQLRLAVAAFLIGAALEDALRRLCDAQGIAYEVDRTSISKLQTALYQPSKRIEVVTASENKQITAWGETRNNADHGRFGQITTAEVMAMLHGVRGFLDKHLP